jgi:predicted membrane protein
MYIIWTSWLAAMLTILIGFGAFGYFIYIFVRKKFNRTIGIISVIAFYASTLSFEVLKLIVLIVSLPMGVITYVLLGSKLREKLKR